MPLFKSLFYMYALLIAFFPSEESIAQDKNPVYSRETEAKIKQVENSLAGWYQASADSLTLWNLKDRMAWFHVPGVSIAVIHNYKIEWARGYGWADTNEHRLVNTSTLFQAASISKSINAIGILTLAQDKKVDIYADINKYLKTWSFPYDSVAGDKKITLALLLSHQAGLNVGGFEGYKTGKPLPTIDQMLEGQTPANSERLHTLFAPGLHPSYSGGGILLSRKVLEDVSGQSYDQYMWKKVLKPMGMTHSFFTQPPPKQMHPLLATAYDKQGREIEGKFRIYPEMAPDGLWTTPSDLGRYVVETQLAYKGKSRKTLTPEFTRLRLCPYLDSSIAFGTFISKKGDNKYFEHGGQNEGFLSHYFGGIENGEGVVIMVNSSNGTALINEIVSSVSLVYGWKNFYHPETKKVISVPNELLQTYTGEYMINNRISYTIGLKGENLVLIVNHKDVYSLLFTSEAEFFIYEAPYNGRFVKNAAGVVDTIIINRDREETFKAIRKY